MPEANQTIKLKAVDEASGVFEKAGARLRALNLEARHSGENQLTKALQGGGNAVEATMRLLGVGLEGAITEQIGRAFEQGTAKLIEMRAQIRAGTANAADMANEFAKSLPILGGFVSGFENIREMITGEAEDIAMVNQEADATTKYFEAQVEQAKRLRDLHTESLDIMRQITNEARLAGMVGESRKREEAQQRHQAAIDAANKQYQLDSEAADKDPALVAAKKALEKFKQDNGALLASLQSDQSTGAGDKEMLKKLGVGGGFSPYPSGDDLKIKELTDTQADLQKKLQDLGDNAANIKLGKEKVRDDKLKAANTQLNLDNAATDIEYNKKREQEAFAHAQRIAAINAEAQQHFLEAAGKPAEAAVAAMQASKAAEVAEAQQRRDVAIEEGGDLQTRLLAHVRYGSELIAIEAKYRAEQSDLAKRQRNEQAEHDAGVNQQLAEGRLTAMKEEARHGNYMAAIEAKRLEVQIEFNKRREEYNRIIRDEHATDAQRAQAKSQRDALDSQEQQALKYANLQDRRFNLATLQEGGHLTGLAAKAREENDPNRIMVAAFQKAEKQRDDANKLLLSINAKLTGGAVPRIFKGSGISTGR